MSNDHPTLGNGKICYVDLPSKNIQQSADFYSNAFGWNVHKRGDGSLAFNDAVNQVSGTWTTGRTPSAPGILIYIMVDDIEATMHLINENGGKIIQLPGKDAREVTALFTDPTGNILGLYQQRPH